MSGMKTNVVLALAVAAAVAAPAAFATNGYFSHGYGIKSKGMAGVGVALPQDSLAAATNPAGMAFVGNRMDFGLDWFRPNRNTQVVGNASPANNIDYDASDKIDFFVPEFGYNHMASSNMSLGVSVYGNGGMNTSYKRNITLFSSTNSAGVDLAQLIVAPTVAMKLSSNNAVGLSLNLAYQRFKATGLQNFDNASQSSSPGNVTDNGYDSSTGVGVRVGWTGKVSSALTLGATYQTKTNMGKFDKYKGLFAEQGDFDIPASAAVGLAFQASPKTVVAFDIEEIYYSKVRSVGNPLGPVSGGGVLANTLGTDNGAGFGWQDITVYKLGFSTEVNKGLTLRAGWNHGEQPIPATQTFFNLLAPGVMKDHLTMGATWTTAKNSELSVEYMHALNSKVEGTNSIPTAFGGGNANLEMDQNSLGIAYAWKM
jgi:long-chain fatty acid transport protein